MDAVLDLSPYGLRLPLGGLTPQTDLSTLGLDIFASARSHRKGVEIDGTQYTTVKKVAEGEFGYVYKVERNGTPYACKIHKALKTKDDLQSLLCETLIHILLLQASVGERNGPYVPYLYKMGYDKKSHKTYLLTEWMSHTLHEDILNFSKSENDRRLPTILGQVAKALEFLGSSLRFNHRDLHPSNVMIARSFKRVVLIDFGYSCLTWNGLQIKGPSLYNDAPNPCYKPDRDMPFLCMRLYKFYDTHLSPSLLQHIHAMLQGYVRGKSYLHRVQEAEQRSVLYQPCDLGELCPSLGLSNVMDQYEFLNSPEVRVPPGNSAKVERAFRTMRFRDTRRNKHNKTNKNKNNKTNKNNGRTRATLPVNRNVRTIPADS